MPPLLFRLIALSAVLFGAMITTGCYSLVRPTGHLIHSDDQEFNMVNRRAMRLHFDLDAKKSALAERPVAEDPLRDAETGMVIFPTLFVVEPPVWLAERRFEDPEAMERILFVLRERTYRYLLRAFEHPVRVRFAMRHDDELLDGYRVVRLRMAITDVHRGFGPLRYTLGYGLGQTRIQVEGQILEGRDNPIEVGRFAFRAAHGGYAQNGWNWMVLQDEYCLKYAVEEGVTRLTETLAEHFPALQTADGRPFVVVAAQE